MSTGGIIGAVVGGVVGFFIGGPMGAAIGAGIGFGAGLAFDPMTPDMPAPGAPQMGELSFSTAKEGLPIPDFLGTTKVSGNIFWYAGNRMVEIKETQEPQGGKGGAPAAQEVTTGYEHYLSWAMGLCLGPVNTLYTVFSGDDVVWSGRLDCPASGGKETIVLDGLGSMTLYFGTADQVANTTITGFLADPTLSPAYRHICYAFFDDCMIGSYNRVPQIRLALRKSPEFAFNAVQTLGCHDYNPAHACWYLLTCMVGLSEDYLDSVLFSNVAFTLYDENRGVNLLMDRQVECLSMIETILKHIDGVMYWSIEGKLALKLIRADTSIDNLPVVTEDDLLDDLQLNRGSWLDTVNELKVQYSMMYDDVYMGTIGGGVYNGLLDSAFIANGFMYDSVVRNVCDGIVAVLGNATGPGTYNLYLWTFAIDSSGQITEPAIDSYFFGTNVTQSYHDMIQHNSQSDIFITTVGDRRSGAHHDMFMADTFRIEASGEITFLDHADLSTIAGKKCKLAYGTSDSGYNLLLTSSSSGGYPRIYSFYVSDSGLIGLASPYVITIGPSNPLPAILHIDESSWAAGKIAVVYHNSSTSETLLLTYSASPLSLIDSKVLYTTSSSYIEYRLLHLRDDLYIVSRPGKLYVVEISNAGIIGEILSTLAVPWATGGQEMSAISSDTFIQVTMNAYNLYVYSYYVSPAGIISLMYAPPSLGYSHSPSVCNVSDKVYAISDDTTDSSLQMRTIEITRGADICEGGNFREGVVVARDIANQKTVGRITHRTVKMGLFSTEVNAAWGADRILKEKSYPFASGSFPANRNLFKLEPGDSFVLNYTPYGITGKVFLVKRIEEASVESEEITVYVAENAWYSGSAAIVNEIPSYGTALDVSVEALPNTKVIEAPYVFAAETTQALTLAARNTLTELGYKAFMSLDSTTYSRIGLVPSYCVHGLLVAEYASGGYTLDDSVGFEVDFTNADVAEIQSVGRSDLLAGKNWALLGDELICFQTITPVSGLRYSISGIFRARFDTEKVTHAINTPFFFLGEGNWGAFQNAQFLPGATRYFKYVPYNMKVGGLIDEAVVNNLAISGRAYTPYRPINLKANSVSAHSTYYQEDIVLSWSPRLRGSIGVGKGNAGTVTDAAVSWEGLFKVEVYVGAVLVRTTDSIDDDTWTYTSAMNQTDNGGWAGEVTFKVSDYIVGGNAFVYESAQTEIIVKEE